MNPIIKKQLEQVKVADLSNYDATTRTFNIPKFNQVRLIEGKSYIIRLEPSLLKPNPGDTFHINWNRGSIPSAECMLIEVGRINGRTIYVDGVEYLEEQNKSTSVIWSGWLPVERINIIREV